MVGRHERTITMFSLSTNEFYGISTGKFQTAIFRCIFGTQCTDELEIRQNEGNSLHQNWFLHPAPTAPLGKTLKFAVPTIEFSCQFSVLSCFQLSSFPPLWKFSLTFINATLSIVVSLTLICLNLSLWLYFSLKSFSLWLALEPQLMLDSANHEK